MHYLKFKNQDTFDQLEKNGIDKISSLGYSNVIGFRCGTAQTYSPYNLKDQKTYQIKVQPLIITDTALNINNSEHNLKKVIRIIETCKKVNGNLTILWHNCNMINKKRLYIEILNNL